MQPHPFDTAIALTAVAGDSFAGHAGSAYWNMIGPFGGISAATALNAVMQHPSRLGEPVSLTVNYATAIANGPLNVTARAARTSRSTQHWIIEFTQPGEDGTQAVLTATALTAVRRSTWGANDMPMPEVPPPDGGSPQPAFAPMEWLKRYEMRAVAGALPRAWDGALRDACGADASLTQLWIQDVPARAMDFCALAAYADIFFPRIFLRRAKRVTVGTVSMTVYFHVGGELLRTFGSAPVLGQARGQVFSDGFFDQSAQLWSQSGTLLVTSSQIVYYRE